MSSYRNGHKKAHSQKMWMGFLMVRLLVLSMLYSKLANKWRQIVASPGGFEPPLPPWKGGVLGL